MTKEGAGSAVSDKYRLHKNMGEKMWPTQKRIQKLRRDIRKGTTVGGSDGLLKYGNGGAGWKLAISAGCLSIIEIQIGVAPVDSVS